MLYNSRYIPNYLRLTGIVPEYKPPAAAKGGSSKESRQEWREIFDMEAKHEIPVQKRS